MHTCSSRAASGGGAAETCKNTGGERTPHRMHNGSSRAASGGGAAETRKNMFFFFVFFFFFEPLRICYLPPIECILGPICGIAFLRGSLKCVVEARSPNGTGKCRK